MFEIGNDCAIYSLYDRYYISKCIIFFLVYTKIMEENDCDGAPSGKWNPLAGKKYNLDTCFKICKSHHNSEYVVFGRPGLSWTCSGTRCACKCSIVPSLGCESTKADGAVFDLYKVA